MNQVAIIDMGTNTFHLLVAQWDNYNYQLVCHDWIPTRIGVGSINKNYISPEAIGRILDALRFFKKRADDLRVDKIFAFGTSALRNAVNGPEIVSQIQQTTGIHTQLISGNEEARLIYEGVNLALNLGSEKSLIVDIGGGSVEFIIGNGKEIFWKQSFEIGGQRLLEQFQPHDPILSSEIESLNSHFENSLTPLFEQLKIHLPVILAGSSGTFDTLSDIYCSQQNIRQKETPETPFDIHSFEKIYHEIISKNRNERMKINGMIELRVDMIVVACCLIKFLIDKFHFEKIRVSSFSLREGVLALLMKRTRSINA